MPVALVFTAISYTCLSFGFATANHIFGIRLRRRDLAEISFVSIVLNHLISAGGAAGYSVRFLLMGEQGASARDILAASLFKRMRKSDQTANPIAVLGRRSFGRTGLILIEVEGRKFLLSQSPEEIGLVSALAPEFESFEEELTAPKLVAGNDRSA